jgi:hypothetical protein
VHGPAGAWEGVPTKPAQAPADTTSIPPTVGASTSKMMTANSRRAEALGAIGALLVEHEARVGLNEIRDILEALDARAYADGFRNGRERLVYQANWTAEPQDPLHLSDGDLDGWD